MYSLFFFFKQKTAYEMRISDWSSDVCSSDLNRYCLHLIAALLCFQKRRDCTCPTPVTFLISVCNIRGRYITVSTGRRTIVRATECDDQGSMAAVARLKKTISKTVKSIGPSGSPRRRSEEHTSELQSLMRISYAVFCLKKT